MSLRKILVVLMVVGMNTLLYGQSVNSPYSNNGIGELAYQGLPNNYGMGEVGIGTPSLWHINIQNPAFLIYNNFSSFQVGIDADFRKYTSNAGEHKSNFAGLRFLAMSFPMIKGKWSSSLALLPVSSVNFNTFSQDSVGSAYRLSQYKGEGGLSQLVWGNGFRIYRSLSLGVKVAYVFGEVRKTSRDRLFGDDLTTDYIVSYNENTSYSDFNVTVALGYKWKLDQAKFINFGFTHQISRELVGSMESYYERQTSIGSAIQRIPISEDDEAIISLPVSYGLGASFESLNRLKIGADVILRNWKSSNTETTGATLRNIFDLGVGAEWIPDNTSVNNYLKRASYRVGFSYQQLPYLVNSTEINDFGINFGASFPVSGFSSLDAAFKYGFRGTTENDLIRENYFQVVIGATINDNQWFIKRRYD